MRIMTLHEANKIGKRVCNAYEIGIAFHGKTPCFSCSLSSISRSVTSPLVAFSIFNISAADGFRRPARRLFKCRQCMPSSRAKRRCDILFFLNHVRNFMLSLYAIMKYKINSFLYGEV